MPDECVFDLRELLDEIGRHYEVLAENLGIVMALEIPGNLPKRLYGDPRGLRDILHNLISCCLGNLDEGGIFLQVSARPVAGGKYRIELNIDDTGLGIPDYKLRTIFQPAYLKNVDDNAYRVSPSLYLAKTLTTLLGGELTVASSYGRGTRYALRLDLKTEVYFGYLLPYREKRVASGTFHAGRKITVAAGLRRLVRESQKFDPVN